MLHSNVKLPEGITLRSWSNLSEMLCSPSTWEDKAVEAHWKRHHGHGPVTAEGAIVGHPAGIPVAWWDAHGSGHMFLLSGKTPLANMSIVWFIFGWDGSGMVFFPSSTVVFGNFHTFPISMIVYPLVGSGSRQSAIKFAWGQQEPKG
jgi:hypothetical protein